MCGINGILSLNENDKSLQIIALMNNSLKHRGPNDEGVFVENTIALGHRRLSIIDLSDAGHQPMLSDDGNLVIVYNGELYNYLELKVELKDYNYKTNTDTEVILAAYKKWGYDCLNHFNGMYAFAIWNRSKKNLFIARDRAGIKPLYYFQQNNTLIFSSEIRALLSTNLIPKKLNGEALADYLRYQTVHAPDTILKDVSMLMPGHYIIASENNFDIKKYWEPSTDKNPEAEQRSYSSICKEINKILFDAVERRLVADVPFGAFLSGGIDSSAVVGIMSKIAQQKVKTFSVVFDDSEFSEAKYARLVAEKFNTEHHEIKLTPADFLNELPNALKAMDHPSGDGPNTYVVSKATKNAGVTMALSGLGGDELFAGYPVFKRSQKLEQLKWLKNIPLQKLMGNILKLTKQNINSEKLSALFKLNDWNISSTYPLSRLVLTDEKINQLLIERSLPENRVHQILNSISSNNSDNNNYLLSRISIAEITTYMQNTLLRDTDQMSMANALEVRVPFLDYKLVEYVLSIPDKYKNPVTPKKLLIDSLQGLLPDEIINRTKMGFTFPWKLWMKNELKNYCEERIKKLASRTMFNEQGVLNWWQKFLNNDPSVTWSRVWHLIVLENWLTENNIEN